MADLWSFLLDESNRTILGWIGGGLVIAVGGIWAVAKFFLSARKGNAESAGVVTATRGGVSAGRDIRNSDINTSRE